MSSGSTIMTKIKTTLANILIGIPGGALIFMASLMFTALLGRLMPVVEWLRLLLLCLCALIVGLLARLVRPINGFGAAVASGVVTALLLLYLYTAGVPGSESRLVFGLPGMLAAPVFSTLGGWLLPFLRRGRR